MAIFNGTKDANKIYGTNQADTINGVDGQDYLSGGAGNDTLNGGNHNDKVEGGAGNDTLYGGSGVDALFGGDGADRLYGDDGDDYLSGGKGDDQLFGGNGNDRLLGGEGSDSVDGGAGNDTVVWEQHGIVTAQQNHFHGGSGTDTLNVIAQAQIPSDPTSPALTPAIAMVGLGDTGSAGYLNFVSGRQEVGNTVGQGTIDGFEKITVGANTQLDYCGGKATMTVIGGAQDDMITFGSGNEYIDGGAGADIFKFNMWDGQSKGHDVIYNFNKGEDFFVLLGASPYDDRQLDFTQVEKDGNTYITATDAEHHQVIDLTLAGATGLSPDILSGAQDWWG